MKKYVICLGISCCLFLSGCSEEVENTNNNVTNKDNATTVEQNSDSVNLAEVDDTENKLDNPIQENNEPNTSIEQKKPNEEEKSSEKISVLNDNTNKGLYEFYLEQVPTQSDNSTVVKSEEGEISSDKQENILKFNIIDSETIELPIYEENKEYLTEDLQQVSLTDLVKDGIAKFIEEPIEQGYLITLDLEQMNKLYTAQSYSISYDQSEYALMLSDVYPTTGISVIGGVNEEDLDKAKVLIIN